MAPHQRSYDLVVIGAGAVGENVADYAHQRGLSVVIVESELVGGECSYWACMPSKALLRSGSALHAARQVDGARQAVCGTIDVAAVLRRRDRIVSGRDDTGQVAWLDGAGISLLRGTARLTGAREVTVTGTDGAASVLKAAFAVAVCTGSAALLPDIPGLKESAPWTSREATSVEQIPPSLAIIGGGVVAAELSTAYASLGCSVTLIARGGLLGGMEPFAGELVGKALAAAGVDLRLGQSPTGVTRTEHGDVQLTLEDGATVQAAELLVATGRLPRTASLGLDSVGLRDGDWLEVDDTLLVRAETNAEQPWLYAVGDVNHRALLTHQGKYQARAAGEVIAARAVGRPVQDARWGAHVATADAAAVPQVTFTDPEVAAVGLTAAAARKKGHRVRTVDYSIGDVAGATVHSDRYTGTARLVVDEDRGVLVGATFVGRDVAEMLQAATIAIVGEVPVDRLWHAVPAYPTLNEVWLRLLETYGRPE